MNPTTRSSLQSYQCILYDRALHPELFQIQGRRKLKSGDYELEAWAMPGGHVLRFDFKSICLTELVTDKDRDLPNSGVITAFLCAGERDYEHRFEKTKTTYMHTVQSESLSENLYRSTFKELLEFAGESGALTFQWEDDHGKNLTIIDLQRYSREAHAQAYHCQANGGVVLRTQSIFEHA